MAMRATGTSWVTFSGYDGEKSGAGVQEGISVWINESMDICIGFEHAGDYYCMDPHDSRVFGMYIYESSQRIINGMNNMSGDPWGDE